MWTSVGYNTAKKHAVCAHWRACMRERARAREREREQGREGEREREREREKVGGEREQERVYLGHTTGYCD